NKHTTDITIINHAYNTTSPFIFYRHAAYLDLLSFPTRRSSDLFRMVELGQLQQPRFRHFGHAHVRRRRRALPFDVRPGQNPEQRSEEQRLNSSHVAISYAVFCLKKKIVTITS